MKKVEISKALLLELISEIEGSARIIHSRYDRKTKEYLWNDEIWRAADPHRFKMVQKARVCVGKNQPQATDTAHE